MNFNKKKYIWKNPKLIRLCVRTGLKNVTFRKIDIQEIFFFLQYFFPTGDVFY